MANRYIYHGGSNTSPYDTWAKAATTISTAATGSSAGDDFWVASDHSETTAAAITPSFPGTSASPNRCISVSRAGSTPPVAADILAGGAVATTGANSNMTISGHVYVYGLTFNIGDSSNTASIRCGASGNLQTYEACAFNLTGTSTSSNIAIPNFSGSFVRCINCTVSFGATGQSIGPAGPALFTNKGGSVFVTGATIPTTLFSLSNVVGEVVVDGLDLSASGSGKTLVGATSSAIKIQNCKLGSSVTIASTPSNANAPGVRLIGCSTTTNVERNEIYAYQGTLTTETTIIRTAGASDGTTAYSWKVVTTANAKRTAPFETFEGAVWNSATGSSKTLTVHAVFDSGTQLTDAEIWVEVEYLGSSATPVATLITDANATVLTTAANQSSDSEAWTTTGLSTPLKLKLDVTFTPQMAGPIRWKVKVAKASTTVYIDPNVDIT